VLAPVHESVYITVTILVPEPVSEPVSEPLPEPVPEPVPETVPDPVPDPVPKPVTKPVPLQAATPEPDNVIAPISVMTNGDNRVGGGVMVGMLNSHVLEKNPTINHAIAMNF